MKVIEEPQLAVKRKWPWLIDIFLYPMSASGVVHLAVFLIAPFLLGWIYRQVLSGAGYVGAVISFGLYVLLVGYVFYYLAYCVIDSARGGRRAPDISIKDTPGKGEVISQLMCVIGGIAFCFWPVAVYYIFTERADLIFWLLYGCGIFFLPMALLAVLMFDALDALNPIMIVKSVFKTFFTYLALVPVFCALGWLIYLMISDLPEPKILRQVLIYLFLLLDYLFSPSFVCRGIVFIYLAMVGAHLLGCFYWWRKDKLDWGL